MNHNPSANAESKPAALIKLDALIHRIHNSKFHCAITANTSNARYYLKALHDCAFVLASEFHEYSGLINNACSKATLALNKNREVTHAEQ